jgi:hypothetical protein
MLGIEEGGGVAGGDGGAQEEEEETASAAPGIAHTAASHALFSRGAGKRRGECLCALTEEEGVHVNGLLRAGVVQGLLVAVLHVFERVRQRAAELLARVALVLPELLLTSEQVRSFLALGEELTLKSARRYSVYLLSWYKSTNTDAEERAKVLSLLAFLVQMYKY